MTTSLKSVLEYVTFFFIIPQIYCMQLRINNILHIPPFDKINKCLKINNRPHQILMIIKTN